MAGATGFLGHWTPALHPRDRRGRFRDAWNLSEVAKKLLDRVTASFRPLTAKDDNEMGAKVRRLQRPHTPDQTHAIHRFYTRSGNDHIQSALRSHADERAAGFPPEIQHMRAAEQPLPQDMILTRVSGPDMFGLPPERINEVEEWTGKLVSDLGFFPTNVGTPAPIQGPHVTWSILAPRGTPAIIQGGGNRGVILSDHQPIRIVRVERKPDGGSYVYAAVMPKQSGAKEGPRGLGRELAAHEKSPAIEATPEEMAKRGLTPEGQPGAPQAPSGIPQGEQPALGPHTPVPKVGEAQPAVSPTRQLQGEGKAGAPVGAGHVTQPGEETPTPAPVKARGGRQVATPEEARQAAEAKRLDQQRATQEAAQKRLDAQQAQIAKQQQDIIKSQQQEIDSLRQQAGAPAAPAPAPSEPALSEGGTKIAGMSEGTKQSILDRVHRGEPRTEEDVRQQRLANQIMAERGQPPMFPEIHAPSGAPPAKATRARAAKKAVEAAPEAAPVEAKPVVKRARKVAPEAVPGEGGGGAVAPEAAKAAPVRAPRGAKKAAEVAPEAAPAEKPVAIKRATKASREEQAKQAEEAVTREEKRIAEGKPTTRKAAAKKAAEAAPAEAIPPPVAKKAARGAKKAVPEAAPAPVPPSRQVAKSAEEQKILDRAREIRREGLPEDQLSKEDRNILQRARELRARHMEEQNQRIAEHLGEAAPRESAGPRKAAEPGALERLMQEGRTPEVSGRKRQPTADEREALAKEAQRIEEAGGPKTREEDLIVAEVKGAQKRAAKMAREARHEPKLTTEQQARLAREKKFTEGGMPKSLQETASRLDAIAQLVKDERKAGRVESNSLRKGPSALDKAADRLRRGESPTHVKEDLETAADHLRFRSEHNDEELHPGGAEKLAHEASLYEEAAKSMSRRGPAAGKVSASDLSAGDKVLVTKNADGKWVPATKKTGATPITVSRTETIGKGAKPRLVVHGRDKDGNEIEVHAARGPAGMTAAQRFFVHEEKKPAVKAALKEGEIPSTIADRRAMAKERNIPGYSRMNKDELGRAIQAHMDREAAGEPHPEATRPTVKRAAKKVAEAAVPEAPAKAAPSKRVTKKAAEAAAPEEKPVVKRATRAAKKAVPEEKPVVVKRAAKKAVPEAAPAEKPKTLTQLRSEAKTAGIRGYTRMDRKSLEDGLKAHHEGGEKPAPAKATRAVKKAAEAAVPAEKPVVKRAAKKVAEAAPAKKVSPTAAKRAAQKTARARAEEKHPSELTKVLRGKPAEATPAEKPVVKRAAKKAAEAAPEPVKARGTAKVAKKAVPEERPVVAKRGVRKMAKAAAPGGRAESVTPAARRQLTGDEARAAAPSREGRIKPNGMIPIGKLQPGDRVLLIRNKDGEWRLSNGKTGTPVTVDHVPVTSSSRTPFRTTNYKKIVGHDDHGNLVETNSHPGHTTARMEPLGGTPKKTEGQATEEIRRAARAQLLTKFRDDHVDERDHAEFDRWSEQLRGGSAPALVKKRVRSNARYQRITAEHRRNMADNMESDPGFARNIQEQDRRVGQEPRTPAGLRKEATEHDATAARFDRYADEVDKVDFGQSAKPTVTRAAKKVVPEAPVAKAVPAKRAAKKAVEAAPEKPVKVTRASKATKEAADEEVLAKLIVVPTKRPASKAVKAELATRERMASEQVRSMPLPALKAKAKAMGIPGHARMRRADLEEAVARREALPDITPEVAKRAATDLRKLARRMTPDQARSAVRDMGHEPRGETTNDIINNAVQDGLQRRIDESKGRPVIKRAAEKVAKAAVPEKAVKAAPLKRVKPEEKDFAPGGAKHIDLSHAHEGIGEHKDFDHPAGNYINDAQEQLNHGDSPADVAERLTHAAKITREMGAISHGGVRGEKPTAERAKLMAGDKEKADKLDKLAEKIRGTKRPRFTARKAEPTAEKPAERPVKVTRAAEKVAKKAAPAEKPEKFLPPLANGTRRKSVAQVKVGDLIKRGVGQRKDYSEPQRVAKVENGIITFEDGTKIHGMPQSVVHIGEAKKAAKRAAPEVSPHKLTEANAKAEIEHQQKMREMIGKATPGKAVAKKAAAPEHITPAVMRAARDGREGDTVKYTLPNGKVHEGKVVGRTAATRHIEWGEGGAPTRKGGRTSIIPHETEAQKARKAAKAAKVAKKAAPEAKKPVVTRAPGREKVGAVGSELGQDVTQRYAGEGHTVKQIAEDKKLSESTVRRILNEHGVQMRPRGGSVAKRVAPAAPAGREGALHERSDIRAILDKLPEARRNTAERDLIKRGTAKEKAAELRRKAKFMRKRPDRHDRGAADSYDKIADLISPKKGRPTITRAAPAGRAAPEKAVKAAPTPGEIRAAKAAEAKAAREAKAAELATSRAAKETEKAGLFGPGGAKHIDTEKLAEGLDRKHLKHAQGDYLSDAQKELDRGTPPSQVAKRLRLSAQARRNHAAYQGLGEPTARQQKNIDRVNNESKTIDELASRIEKTRRPTIRRAVAKAVPEAPAERPVIKRAARKIAVPEKGANALPSNFNPSGHERLKVEHVRGTDTEKLIKTRDDIRKALGMGVAGPAPFARKTTRARVHNRDLIDAELVRRGEVPTPRLGEEAPVKVAEKAVKKAAPEVPLHERAEIRKIADRLPEGQRRHVDEILTGGSQREPLRTRVQKAAVLRRHAAGLRQTADNSYKTNPDLAGVREKKQHDDAVADHLDRIADHVYQRPGTTASRKKLPEIRETLDSKLAQAGFGDTSRPGYREVLDMRQEHGARNDRAVSLRERAQALRERAAEISGASARRKEVTGGKRIKGLNAAKEREHAKNLERAASIFEEHANSLPNQRRLAKKAAPEVPAEKAVLAKAERPRITRAGRKLTDEERAGILTKLNNWENPPTREDSHALIKDVGREDLVKMARELNIPGTSRKNQETLRHEIVQATSGARRDSIAIRGFKGARPAGRSEILHEQELSPAGRFVELRREAMAKKGEPDVGNLSDKQLHGIDGLLKSDAEAGKTKSFDKHVRAAVDKEMAKRAGAPEAKPAAKRAARKVAAKAATPEAAPAEKPVVKRAAKKVAEAAPVEKPVVKRAAKKAVAKAVPAEATPAEKPKNLTQLKEEARAAGIPGYSRKTKPQLEEMLRQHRESGPAEKPKITRKVEKPIPLGSEAAKERTPLVRGKRATEDLQPGDRIMLNHSDRLADGKPGPLIPEVVRGDHHAFPATVMRHNKDGSVHVKDDDGHEFDTVPDKSRTGGKGHTMYRPESAPEAQRQAEEKRVSAPEERAAKSVAKKAERPTITQERPSANMTYRQMRRDFEAGNEPDLSGLNDRELSNLYDRINVDARRDALHGRAKEAVTRELRERRLGSRKGIPMEGVKAHVAQRVAARKAVAGAEKATPAAPAEKKSLADLRSEASQAQIPGRSRMTKEQLTKAIADYHAAGGRTAERPKVTRVAKTAEAPAAEKKVTRAAKKVLPEAQTETKAPSGTVIGHKAQKGDLVVAERTERIVHQPGFKTEEQKRFHVGKVTRVSRDGEVQEYQLADGTKVKTANDPHGTRYHLSPSQNIDVEKSLQTARENPWHTRLTGGEEKKGAPYRSLAEVRKALMPHKTGGREKLEVSRKPSTAAAERTAKAIPEKATTRKLTAVQQSTLDEVRGHHDSIMKEGQGSFPKEERGWISERDISRPAVARTLAKNGHLEEREAAGPRGGVVREYRPIERAAAKATPSPTAAKKAAKATTPTPAEKPKNLRQLQDEAKAAGLRGYSRKTKPQLEEMLKQHHEGKGPEPVKVTRAAKKAEKAAPVAEKAAPRKVAEKAVPEAAPKPRITRAKKVAEKAVPEKVVPEKKAAPKTIREAQQVTPAPKSLVHGLPEGANPRRAHLDMGPDVAQRVGRTNGDEKLHLPNGGADQGRLHLDSEIGQLWQDLVSDKREPNSRVNKIARMGEDVGTGKMSLDQAAHELRQMAKTAPDAGVARRLDHTAGAISAPGEKPKVDLPEGTPASVRKLVEDLNDIPTMRKTDISGHGHHGEGSIVDRAKALVERAHNDPGSFRPGEFEQSIHDLAPHESMDGGYQAQRILGKFRSDATRDPEIRKWLRRERGALPAGRSAVPEGETRSLTELRDAAGKAGIPGRSRMNRGQLAEALKKHEGGAPEAKPVKVTRAAKKAPAAPAEKAARPTVSRAKKTAEKTVPEKAAARALGKPLPKRFRDKTIDAFTPEHRDSFGRNLDLTEARSQDVAVADAARRAAPDLIGLDKAIEHGGSEKALLHHVDALEHEGVKPELLKPVREAISSGDRDKMRGARNGLLDKMGLEQIGHSGQKTTLDPEAHKRVPDSGSLRKGSHVDVFSPGYRLKKNGLIAQKADVAPAGGEAQAAKKAAVKPRVSRLEERMSPEEHARFKKLTPDQQKSYLEHRALGSNDEEARAKALAGEATPRRTAVKKAAEAAVPSVAKKTPVRATKKAVAETPAEKPVVKRAAKKAAEAATPAAPAEKQKTLSELHAEAKATGFKGYSRMKRDDLAKALEEHKAKGGVPEAKPVKVTRAAKKVTPQAPTVAKKAEPAKAEPAPVKKATTAAKKVAPEVAARPQISRAPAAKKAVSEVPFDKGTPTVKDEHLTAEHWQPGEGIPTSTLLAARGKLGEGHKSQDLHAMDGAMRNADRHDRVPALYQKVDDQLKKAGVGENERPRKELRDWYHKTFPNGDKFLESQKQHGLAREAEAAKRVESMTGTTRAERQARASTREENAAIRRRARETNDRIEQAAGSASLAHELEDVAHHGKGQDPAEFKKMVHERLSAPNPYEGSDKKWTGYHEMQQAMGDPGQYDTPEKLRAAIRKNAADRGITIGEPRGEHVKFQRGAHEHLGGETVREGTTMEVHQPSMTFHDKETGGDVSLNKAVVKRPVAKKATRAVKAATPEAAPAPAPEKRVVKRAAKAAPEPTAEPAPRPVKVTRAAKATPVKAEPVKAAPVKKAVPVKATAAVKKATPAKSATPAVKKAAPVKSAEPVKKAAAPRPTIKKAAATKAVPVVAKKSPARKQAPSAPAPSAGAHHKPGLLGRVKQSIADRKYRRELQHHVLTGRLRPSQRGEIGISHILKGKADTPPEGVRVKDLIVPTDTHDEYHVRSGVLHRKNGVTYLIEHNGSPTQHRDAQKMYEYLQAHHAALPAEARKYQRSYAAYHGENPSDRIVRREYGLASDWSAWGSAKNGHTQVWQTSQHLSTPRDRQYLSGIMNHEFAHNVDHSVPEHLSSGSHHWEIAAQRDRGPQLRVHSLRLTTGILSSDEPLGKEEHGRAFPYGVTPYGTSSAAEDYGDSVKMYLEGKLGTGLMPGSDKRVPVYFRDMFPERAHILDQVFPDFARAQNAEIERLRPSAHAPRVRLPRASRPGRPMISRAGVVRHRASTAGRR